MNKKVGKMINYLNNQNRAYVNVLVKKEDLTYGECQILLLVDHFPGISQEKLREDIKIDKSAITRMVKSLLGKKYIIKQVNEQDRRTSCLFLTKLGNLKIPIIRKALDEGNQRMIEGLNKKEQEQVLYLLHAMCKYIEGNKGE